MYATDKSVTSKLPDWVKIGVRVRSTKTARHGTVMGAYFHEILAPGRTHVTLIWDGDDYASGVHVSEVVPVTRWIPEKGETVACWGPGQKRVQVHSFEPNCFVNVARIPDNWAAEGYPLSVEWWANQERYEED